MHRQEKLPIHDGRCYTSALLALHKAAHQIRYTQNQQKKWPKVTLFFEMQVLQ